MAGMIFATLCGTPLMNMSLGNEKRYVGRAKRYTRCVIFAGARRGRHQHLSMEPTMQSDNWLESPTESPKPSNAAQNVIVLRIMDNGRAASADVLEPQQPQRRSHATLLAPLPNPHAFQLG